MDYNTQVFDLIFADPPFDLEKLASLPYKIFDGNHLEKTGIFILEHPEDHDFSKNEFFIETRRYGKVHFSFFGRKTIEG